jgi:nucleoside-diphosphate-sugar epimerase
MKVLVTGATGFIGNYVITELLKKNVEVIATSTNTSKAQNFDWFDDVTYLPFNLKEFDSSVNYFEYFDEPDVLIHLAWEGLPNYKDLFHIDENLPRHYNFLENIIRNGLKDMTITGTCFEYGMKEGCLDEEMKCEPTIAYGKAKNELREQIENLKCKQEFSFKWIRLFYMYGKGQSKNSLISQLDWAVANNNEVFNMSGGKQIRDFLPVEKVAENIVKAAMQNEVIGVINCCSGKEISLKEFVINYLKEKNKNIKLNPGFYPYTDYEPMRFWGNNIKMKKIEKNKYAT